MKVEKAIFIVFFLSLSLAFLFSENRLDVTDTSPSIIQPSSILSEAEAFTYINEVSSWNYGYIDEKHPGEPGFSLPNLQTDDNMNALLSEASILFVKRFEYTFRIPCDSWSTYQTYELQVEGYCDRGPEPLQFFWGVSDSTTDSLLGTIEIDEITPIQKSWPIDVTGYDSIYIRVVDS